MLHFDSCFLLLSLASETVVSEANDSNKTNISKECNINHYWYFLDEEFNSQPYVCNGCHDVLMMSINLNDISILNIHGVYYCSNIKGISKSEAVNLLQNVDLTEKSGVLWK